MYTYVQLIPPICFVVIVTLIIKFSCNYTRLFVIIYKTRIMLYSWKQVKMFTKHTATDTLTARFSNRTATGCTIGNVTNYLVYQWWSSWSFYPWHKTVCGHLLHRSVHLTKWIRFVNSKSHSCQVTPLRLPEVQGLTFRSWI
jgi:hypothetical protein